MLQTLTRPSDPLAALDIQDVDGRPVRIGELISGELSILVFLRHFG